MIWIADVRIPSAFCLLSSLCFDKSDHFNLHKMKAIVCLAFSANAVFLEMLSSPWRRTKTVRTSEWRKPQQNTHQSSEWNWSLVGLASASWVESKQRPGSSNNLPPEWTKSSLCMTKECVFPATLLFVCDGKDGALSVKPMENSAVWQPGIRSFLTQGKHVFHTICCTSVTNDCFVCSVEVSRQGSHTGSVQFTSAGWPSEPKWLTSPHLQPRGEVPLP